MNHPTFKSHLRSIDLLLKTILEDLDRSPNDWVEEVKLRKAELLETFYLTAADKPKVGEELCNFRVFCSDRARSGGIEQRTKAAAGSESCAMDSEI